VPCRPRDPHLLLLSQLAGAPLHTRRPCTRQHGSEPTRAPEIPDPPSSAGILFHQEVSPAPGPPAPPQACTPSKFLHSNLPLPHQTRPSPLPRAADRALDTRARPEGRLLPPILRPAHLPAAAGHSPPPPPPTFRPARSRAATTVMCGASRGTGWCPGCHAQSPAAAPAQTGLRPCPSFDRPTPQFYPIVVQPQTGCSMSPPFHVVQLC
jgi:hypothetical protein